MARIGRPPKPQASKKRTFYIPLGVANWFKRLCGGKPSRPLAGAMLFYGGATANIQKQLADLAETLPPEQAVTEIRRRMPEWLEEILLAQHMAALSPQERSRIIQAERDKVTKQGR
jgi:hypothetical protein